VSRQRIILTIDLLRPEDIPAAVAVEQAAYLTPWPQKDYQHELEQNRLAHYLALRLAEEQAGGLLVGLAGFWLIAGDIHITTIAIQPRWKGLGLGEWLLLNLLEEGEALGGTVATLEVRVSNQVARSLYQKYSFQEVGRRRDYYPDHETALILTTPPLASPDYRALLGQHKAKVRARLAGQNIEVSS
jgi:ribosomal-protein-alanine N-acetyltransferase